MKNKKSPAKAGIFFKPQTQFVQTDKTGVLNLSLSNKKSQATLFVIIGIVLLISVALLLYLKPNFLSDIASELRKASRIPAMAVPVSNFVDSCLNDVTIPGIYLLANNGGYIYFYERALMAENEQIAYHLEFGNDVSPSKEFMENELSRFIKHSLKICINNFN